MKLDYPVVAEEVADHPAGCSNSDQADPHGWSVRFSPRLSHFVAVVAVDPNQKYEHLLAEVAAAALADSNSDPVPNSHTVACCYIPDSVHSIPYQMYCHEFDHLVQTVQVQLAAVCLQLIHHLDAAAEQTHSRMDQDH